MRPSLELTEFLGHLVHSRPQPPCLSLEIVILGTYYYFKKNLSGSEQTTLIQIHEARHHTVCPRSLDPFDIVSYNIKSVKENK